MTWYDYEKILEARVHELHREIQSGAYRAQPSRRVYIPKNDGRLHPLGIAALEEKVVQMAVSTVLNAIYEQDFLGFSSGSDKEGASMTRWTPRGLRENGILPSSVARCSTERLPAFGTPQSTRSE